MTLYIGLPFSLAYSWSLSGAVHNEKKEKERTLIDDDRRNKIK